MAVMDIIVRAEDQASRVLNDVDGSIDQLGVSGERTADKLGSAFDRAADKMGAMGKKMTTRVTLPLIAAGLAAFKLGSDLSESLSQVGTVFGEEAGKIVSASENMDDAFSQADFLGFAGNIGDIAQGLGIAKSEADDVALSVISLGQDLSSFKNVPVEQAVNAITSALTGERESLKGLGIVLKDVDVKQKALELGLWDGVEALSSTAQAQATMALITEKSANSIGDFARTSTGAANKARILKANLLDQAAAMGTKLLPIGEKILGWLDSAIRGFSGLSDPMQTIILAVLGVVAAIGPLLIVGAKLVKSFQVIAGAMKVLNLAFLTNPFFLLALAVVAIAVLIFLNWDKIKKFLLAAWEVIKGALKAVADFFVNTWNTVFEKVDEIIGAIIDFFSELPGNIMKGIADLATTVFDFIVGVFNDAKDAIIETWNDVVSFLSELVPKIIGAIAGFATTVLAFIIKWHPMAILMRALIAVWPSVRSWLVALPGRIIGGLTGLVGRVRTFLDKWSPVAILKRAVIAAWPGALEFIKSLPGRILLALSNLGSLLFNVGKDIIGGLLRGIKAGWDKVAGFVGGLGSKIRNLKGPSQVDRVLLTDNGGLIMDGLLEGLQRSWPKVQSFMSGRGSELESALGRPTLAVSGVGAMDAGSSVGFANNRAEIASRELHKALREQNDLLRKILARTGFSIDGRDLVDAIGPPLVSEIRSRTGI